MYRDLTTDSNRIRTGDIIRLELADFKHILRHEGSVTLYEQYENDPKYKSKLWAVLNKPCDMVHGDGRKFDTNLFLCPLQGFLSTFVPLKGRYADTIKAPGEMPSLVNALEMTANKLIRSELAHRYTQQKVKIDKTELDIDTKKFCDYLSEEFFSKIEINSSPEFIEETFHNYVSQQSHELDETIVKFFEKFNNQPSWIDFKNKRTEVLQAMQGLSISSNGLGQLSELFLNQLDDHGVFFYEPSKDFLKLNDDLSYIIELEDILTLKIKEDLIKNNDLRKLIISKRIVGLTENFSDRLLNIMGVYFSKVGTKDIYSPNILSVYSKAFEGFTFPN